MDEPLEPPPTYALPIVCLVVSLALCGLQVYMVLFQSRIERNSLFVVPGAFLLGAIGLYDPRIPASLQPNARGYPPWTKVVANGCWVFSILIGGILNLTFVGV